MAQMSCRHENQNLVFTTHVLKKTNSGKGPTCNPHGAEAEAGRTLRSVCQAV